eukprot:SAG31_NODE_24500_length_480_cov_0.811024_2_plen_58_part_01
MGLKILIIAAIDYLHKDIDSDDALDLRKTACSIGVALKWIGLLQVSRPASISFHQLVI